MGPDFELKCPGNADPEAGAGVGEEEETGVVDSEVTVADPVVGVDSAEGAVAVGAEEEGASGGAVVEAVVMEGIDHDTALVMILEAQEVPAGVGIDEET